MQQTVQIDSILCSMKIFSEPGYYEEGRFGIRLENILEVKEAFNGRNDSQGNTYLKFEDVTLVPYEPKLIDYNMLTLYQVYCSLYLTYKYLK